MVYHVIDEINDMKSSVKAFDFVEHLIQKIQRQKIAMVLRVGGDIEKTLLARRYRILGTRFDNRTYNSVNLSQVNFHVARLAFQVFLDF